MLNVAEFDVFALQLRNQATNQKRQAANNIQAGPSWLNNIFSESRRSDRTQRRRGEFEGFGLRIKAFGSLRSDGEQHLALGGDHLKLANRGRWLTSKK